MPASDSMVSPLTSGSAEPLTVVTALLQFSGSAESTTAVGSVAYTCAALRAMMSSVMCATFCDWPLFHACFLVLASYQR